MAAKLGAIYLSQEGHTDLDPPQFPASPFLTANYTNLGATRSMKAQGLSPSIVKPRARTAPKLLRKTKVATMLKSHSLPSKLVSWHRDFSSQKPHTDKVSNTNLTPPLPVSPNGTQMLEGLLSLQPLVRSRSLSIFKLPDSNPVALEQEGGVESPHRGDPSLALPDGAVSGERLHDIVSEDGVVSVTRVVMQKPPVQVPALA